MKSLNKMLFFTLSALFLTMPAVHAEINKPDPNRVTTEQLNKMMPRFQNRFCRMKLRPDAVIVLVGIYAVEWSIDRMCSSKLPEGYELP